jgi:hypothetical protein
MARAPLDLLEEEVVKARKRVISDVARLRDPDVRSEFQEDAIATARSFKDDLTDKAITTGSQAAQRVWSDAKTRARANPAAVLAIGAGVLWHVARHPPITTLLIGIGLTSLLRTDRTTPSPFVTTAEDWVETAHELAHDVTERTGRLVQDLGEQTRDAFSTAVRSASEIAGHSSDTVQQVFSDADKRDTYLAGAAALAIGAAAWIAVNRRTD